jgi:hypothetical protein
VTSNSNLRDFLADHYSTHYEARDLWERVGGNPGRILDQAEARTRWNALLQQVDGGAVARVNLLSAVLSDFPGSSVILNELAQEIPLIDREPARQLVRQLLSAEAVPTVDIDFTVLERLPEAQRATAVAIELHQAPPEQQKKIRLALSMIKDKAAEAAVGFLVGKGLEAALAGLALAFGSSS